MGPSAKLAVIAAIVAGGLLLLTGITLALPVFWAFLGVLGLAYLACVLELVLRRRRTVLVLGGAATSIAIACSLGFLGNWGLASQETSSFFGTPLPTANPDHYFYLAGLALAAALVILFVGAVWRTPRRKPATRRPRPTE